MGPNLLKGHLWDSLDKIEEIYWDTSRQIFTLSLINQIVCRPTTRLGIVPLPEIIMNY